MAFAFYFITIAQIIPSKDCGPFQNVEQPLDVINKNEIIFLILTWILKPGVAGLALASIM